MWLTGIDLCTKGKTTTDQRKRHVIKQFTDNWKQKHRGQQEARAAGRLERMQHGASEDLSGGPGSVTQGIQLGE